MQQVALAIAESLGISVDEVVDDRDAIELITVNTCSQREYWPGLGPVNDVDRDVSRISCRAITQFKRNLRACAGRNLRTLEMKGFTVGHVTPTSSFDNNPCPTSNPLQR